MASNFGPCLCGDPECRRCFPSAERAPLDWDTHYWRGADVPLDDTDTTVTAYCGQRVTQWAHSETPTCPGCAAALARSTRPDVFAAGLAQLTAERHARDIGAMQATAAKLGVVGTLETALRTSDRHLCRILIENALMLLKGR